MTNHDPERVEEPSTPPIAAWHLGSWGDSRSSVDAFARSDHERDFRISGGGPTSDAPGPGLSTSPHGAVPPAGSGLRLPEPGQVIGGFRVVSELGRGAFARVYLAEQLDLAGRPVALKVAEALGDEPQALARLQHTHIVPIHSIHDDPATGLRLLCMPYVGGANLAEVLDRAGATADTEASGRSLLQALDRAAGRIPTLAHDMVPPPGERSEKRGEGAEAAATGGGDRRLPSRPWGWASGRSAAGDPGEDEPLPAPDDRDRPARRFLRSHTFLQASVWIGARLAEGLAHAHERGILHRDLKPSNILIADDGTPMLLDFNLAGRVEPDGRQAERARIGGTLPYMAPEHLDAFNPLGMTPAHAVDERSDIYALGLILFEMITGRHPFGVMPGAARTVALVGLMTEERRKGAPSARSIQPLVPPSLDAVIAKCLEPRPERRYARASDLAEDLQRFLDDRANLHAPEPSLRERSAKWWRRHPEVRGAGPVALAAAILVMGSLIATFAVAKTAELAQARLDYGRFQEDFARCQLLLNTASGAASHRRNGIELAEGLLRAYGALSPGPWRPGTNVTRLAPDEQTALREELSELLLLVVRARVADLPRRASNREDLERGISMLERAEAIDPHDSAAMFEYRAGLHRALGEAEASRADHARAAAAPPTTARDFYLRGTQRAAHGDRDGAEADLARAVALDPRRFWAWFVLGVCHFDAGRPVEAVGDFGVCTLLAPDFSWPFLNRGLALAASGRPEAARASFDRALALSPDFVEAYVDRALVCLETGDAGQAVRDLDRAVALGRRDAAVLAARAEALGRLGLRDRAERDFAESLRVRPDDPAVLVARGLSRLVADPSGARDDLGRALALDPRNPRALYGRAVSRRATEPREALRDATTALEIDPRFLDARRLRAVILGRLGDAEAAADAERIAEYPTPHNLYDAACALALLDRARGTSDHRARARRFLDRALKLGYPSDRAAADPDLATLAAPAPTRAAD